jgi:chromate transporter
MMQDEVVQRRKWLSEAHFLDLLGATNLIPGPNSTEMAIHIGWYTRRWSGLVVAGSAFIIPAMLLTGLCGWLYVRFGSLPEASWLLYGVKPVILCVVLQAIWALAPKAVRNVKLGVIGALAGVLAAIGVNEIAVLFGAGVIAIALARVAPRWKQFLIPALPLPLAAGGAAVSAASPSALFLVFLKIGSVLFGSGYVLLAFLRADLVERLGWMTESQLIDAIAVGQVTPGPVFTTATFIGYVLAGPLGACSATLGIFLPAFVFVALSGPLVPRLRASPLAGSFLDGVNVASLALMFVVTLQIGHAALVDVPTVVLAIVSAVLLIRFHVNATWLVVGGAAAGWLLQRASL